MISKRWVHVRRSADISTCTSRVTRQRVNHALKVFGDSQGTLLILERFCFTGVYGCCVVRFELTSLITVAPSNNGRVSGGARAAQYAAVVAPIFTILLYVTSNPDLSNNSLMFLSGLPTAEKPAAKKQFLSSNSSSQSFTPENTHWADYKHYLATTSILIPIPPSLYKPLPEFIKRSVLLDFPMYRFDEQKDGDEALKQERERDHEA